VAIALFIVLLLALVRAYEDQLFYDPFLSYFKSDFTIRGLPQYESIKLYFNLLLRFIVNTLLSLALIYTLFKSIEMIKVAALLYGLFFLIFIGIFVVLLTYFPDNKISIFYVRRFLIQPLLLLLFIPAFYFQVQSEKKSADDMPSA
jgi:exosortase F-associated protein